MKRVLETERLYLKEVGPEDRENLFRLHSIPSVQQYTGEPVVKTMAEIDRAIASRQAQYKKYGYGRWATFLKKEDQFVGWSGLSYLPEFDEIDLGYRLLPEFWGMGIATEASVAILDYGFGVLGLKRIVAIAMKENIASMRVMEKVGMAFDKYAPYDPGGKDEAWYWCDKNLIDQHKSKSS